jgi:hypothetical protein
MTLSGVLMLMMRFTLPPTNEEGSQEILHFVANLHLSPVTDELGRCTAFDNVVFQRINELFVGLHATRVNDGTASSNKNLCSGLTTINSRGVRADSVGSD